MPYTHITGTRNGREAIFYAKGGDHKKGHNNNEQRNLYVGGVGLLPDSVIPYEDQMQVYWRHASYKNKNQIRRIIGSFSEAELSPEDPQAPFLAYCMARDFVEEYYPDRQCAIYIQSDGVGGKLHFHALVNNVSITDYRGCTDEQCRFRYVAENFDKVAERYISLDFGGQDSKDKTTQHERTMRQKNAEGEHHYIWKDDLKSRIRVSMSEAEDRGDYFKKLTEHGVDGTHRDATSKQPEYILYELSDLSGFPEGEKIPHSLKAKSYKLGSDYGYEALDRELSKEPEPEIVAISEPVVIQKTPEQIAEEKRLQEEAERFAKWCSENGYEWYHSSANYMDVDRYEEAVAAYQEFLHTPEEEIFHEDEPEVVLDDTIPEIVPQTEEEIEMEFKSFDKSEDDEDEDEDEDATDGPSAALEEAERQRQALQVRIQQDIAEIDGSVDLQDDFDKMFGDE